MELNTRLYDIFLNQAQRVKVEILSLGLGYTTVSTSNGGIGLSYTYFGDKKSCMVLNKHIDYEGRPAVFWYGIHRLFTPGFQQACRVRR